MHSNIFYSHQYHAMYMMIEGGWLCGSMYSIIGLFVEDTCLIFTLPKISEKLKETHMKLACHEPSDCLH